MKLRLALLLALAACVSAILNAAPLGDDSPPSLEGAMKSLYAERFDEAAGLFQQLVNRNPAAPEPYYGLVRALIDAKKSRDAYAAADKALANAPNTAPAETASGLAEFRKGDLAEAERHFHAALKVDNGYPGALQGLAAIAATVSKFKTARNLLSVAYSREPQDPALVMAHIGTLKGAEHIAALEELLTGVDPDSESARGLRRHIALDKATGEKPVRVLTSPYESTKINLVDIMHGVNRGIAVGIQTKFNGKHTAQLLLDTGASGISISPGFAGRAGLDPLGSLGVTRGIGDGKERATTDYMASEIRAGKVVFERVPVRVFRGASNTDFDGIIGADVFSRFIIGIDFTNRVMTLDPRPVKPTEASADQVEDAAPIPDGFHRAYRFGNHLMVPTTLNGKKTSIFLIDSGAATNSIDEGVASSVTKLHKDPTTTVRGVQGDVTKVLRADTIKLLFAGFSQENSDLIAFNLEKLSDSFGVAVGGILGMPVLRNFKLNIDYASGSIKMDYIHSSPVEFRTKTRNAADR